MIPITISITMKQQQRKSESMNGIESASSVARFLVLAYRTEVYRRAKTCALRLARKLTIASSSPFPSYRPQARNDNPRQNLNERQLSKNWRNPFASDAVDEAPLFRQLRTRTNPYRFLRRYLEAVTTFRPRVEREAPMNIGGSGMTQTCNRTVMSA